MRLAAAALLIVLALAGSAHPAPPASADVVAGAWVETRNGAPVLVVGLYRRPDSKAPEKAWIGCSTGTDDDLPGGYGTIAKDAYREVTLEPGVLVLAARALAGDERERPPSVLVVAAPPPTALNVHGLIVGERPAGALLFARPFVETQVTLSRHVLEVGESAELTVAAPPASFFLDETLEVLVASRRLGIDGDDPAAPPGHARLALLAPEGDDPPVRELLGSAGEQRIRSHFTDPRCAWAERHVGWRADRWVLDLRRPAPIRLRVETDAIARAGVVYDLWKGYNALTLEAIYPNGFGGSSAGLTLPPLLVVPKGTLRRETPLR